MNLTEYDGYKGEVGEEAGQPQAAVEAAQHELHVGLQHAVAYILDTFYLLSKCIYKPKNSFLHLAMATANNFQF